MKYVLVIGDGMADNPVPELDGKTPLQYAKTPAMDKLASAGSIGSVLTIPEGQPPGPRVCYTGRAPLEAAATGVIKLAPGDAAYRCNMITLEDADMPLDEKKLLSHSAGSIEGGQSDALIAALFEAPEFKAAADRAALTVFPASSFRHIAVQKSADIKGMELAPPHDHLGQAAGPLLPRGCDNADVLESLQRIAHKVLDKHPINEKRRAAGKLPANGIWFWAEGTAAALPSFTARYGRTGGVISAVPLCHGIAALVGLEIVRVEGATGELHTNYEGKVDAVIETLKNHDFAAVHIEAPDECTHNGDLMGKLQAIEWIDSRVVAPLMGRLERTFGAYRLLVISDHRTLSTTRAHDGAPVPYIIYDSRLDRKTGRSYCEAEAARGAYIAEGTELMGLLFGDI
jgi:2,3-bisphosphoglycerate-independent phosphoglycerate mutase